MEQDKVVFRTSGFVLYFLSGVILVLFFIVYSPLQDVIQKGINFGNLLAIVLFILGILFLFVLIFLARIEINENFLTIQNSFSKELKWFPRPHNVQISLNEIETVIIARRKYFDDQLKELKNKDLEENVNTMKNLYGVSVIDNMVVPIPLGSATQYAPLIFVKSSVDISKSLVISAKPFSKRTIVEFCKELQKRNIPVVIEDALGLKEIKTKIDNK